MFGLDNLMDMLFDSALESINRNERVIQLLKRLKLDPDHPPEDFTGVYQYALVEYGVGKPRPVLEIFRQSEIQQLFREALEQNNPSKLLQRGEAFLADSPLQADLQSSNVDVRREFYAFAAVFIEVAKRTRTPAEILAEQKLESLHRQIGSVQERLNRLPTIEGLRTELARLAAPSYPALPGSESFSAEQCKAFALAQQMRGWFETLGFDLESHEVWQDDSFEWIINIPVRRGRYDRILVRGIDGEAGLSDVEDLKQSVETHRTDEGWLVTARRISRAARDEVDKAENEGLGCYTLDELLDQDADFSGYLTWLETEIQKRGIDQKYVPLACLKEEIDPDTQQRLGVSRYGDRDGWIDGYIDLWLDDPAKEHISVLGEFGTGKTWFALHYAWKALQRYREAQRRGLERPRLPLVIPLRDYAKAVSVESLFSEFFFRKHEIPIPGYSAFEQLNRMGKLLLIFDGFDEMAARVDRQEMINNFWELAKVVVPGAKVILTCRTEHFPDAKEGRALLNAELQASTRDLTGETPQFEVLELEKFNDEQIRQVLEHQAQPATVEQIMGNPQLLDLARRPVLTELILEALPDIEAGKPVDMSRVYLYAVRHKMERDIKAERTFTSMADKLYFMCELSWEMLSTDRMSINYREFPDRIRKLFGPAVQEEKDLDHWHYDMMGQTMLIRNAEGDYAPAHRSFLEFFTAYKFSAALDLLAFDFDDLGNLQKKQDLSTLISSFGKSQLTKALTDLMLPMISKSQDSQAKLLEIIQLLKRQENDSSYTAGNAITLLVKLNPFALENAHLSHTFIAGADLTTAKLRGTDFSNATIISPILPKGIGNIYSSIISPKGQYLAIGEGVGRIQLCNVNENGKIHPFLVLEGHSDSVSALEFSPDGEFLYSGSHDHSIRIWSALTGEKLDILNGHTDFVQEIQMSHSGGILASGGRDNLIKIWDVDSRSLIRELRGHTRSVVALIFSPDDKTLASGSIDGTVKLWNVETGSLFQNLKGHEDSVHSLLFYCNGTKLASGSSDKTIRLWNTENGKCLDILKGHTDRVSSISSSSNDEFLISSSLDKTLRFWSAENAKTVRILQDEIEYGSISVAKWQHKEILFGTGELKGKLWSLDTFQCLDTLQGYSNYILSVSISSDDQFIVSGDADSVVTIWDISTGKSVRSFQEEFGWIIGVSFDPCNNKIASIRQGRYLQVWNAKTGQRLRGWQVNASWSQALLFTDGGNTIVSGDGNNDVVFWDVNTGQAIKSLKGHTHRVQSLCFGSSENFLITASADKTIKIWDISLEKCLRTLKGHTSQIWSLAIHPNGCLLASASGDKSLRFWDSNSGDCLKIHSSNNVPIFSVAFSSNGLYMVSGEGRYIKVWDPENLKEPEILGEHEGGVLSLCFSTNSNILISGSLDETIKIWDMKSRKCVRTLSNKPYSGLNITNVKGLKEIEKKTLKSMGAIEY